jgi:DNA-binding LacI/PurR family transcriptional regulator
MKARKMPAQRPTLELVAARAGVSRATVSRVVNGSRRVDPGLREAVNRAVDELGYVPDHAARSLVTGRTDSIALILSGPGCRLFADNPFTGGLIRGVAAELDEAGQQLVLLLRDTGAGVERVERYAAGRHVDGAIVVSPEPADPLPGILAELGLPVVCALGDVGHGPVEVGRALTRRLLRVVRGAD